MRDKPSTNRLAEIRLRRAGRRNSGHSGPTKLDYLDMAVIAALVLHSTSVDRTAPHDRGSDKAMTINDFVNCEGSKSVRLIRLRKGSFRGSESAR